MTTVAAWGTRSPTSPIAPLTIERRPVGPHDVALDIQFCGVCHSDIHQARDEWGGSTFPMVPGHEIVGRVTAVGAEVTSWKVGDVGAIGCFVDACRKCGPCTGGLEQFCEKGVAWTYNGTEMDRRTPTFGGYSAAIVVRQEYLLRLPAGLDPAAAAPLLCAGITMYSPLREWGTKPGDRVAVLGLGGLGHMGVKLAAALGAEVTVLSTSAKKEADARRLGATDFVVTSDPRALKRRSGHFDLILDSVSANHGLEDYLRLLRPRGTMVLVGIPTQPASVGAFSLINGNKRLAGSNIGGIAETQEMLDFCAAKKVVADVEVIPPRDVNVAYERMLANDVRYRFVLDLATNQA